MVDNYNALSHDIVCGMCCAASISGGGAKGDGVSLVVRKLRCSRYALRLYRFCA